MNPLDTAAKALYDANPARSYHPDWEMLGEVTKSVWRECAVEHLGLA